MKIELLHNDHNHQELLEAIFEGAEKRCDVCVPTGILNSIPQEVKDNCNLTAIVDFPLGLSDTRLRIHEIVLAARQKVRKVDLVINNHHVEFCDYSSIGKDLKACVNACRENGLELRPIIEHRLHHSTDVRRTCEVLISNKYINQVVLGTGTVVDDPIDNLILAMELKKYLSVEVTACSPVLNQRHLDLYKDSGIDGLRLKSYKLLSNMLPNLV